MAIETVCAICHEKVGRFRYVGGGKYVHVPKCSGGDKVRDTAKSTFPFTTSNLSGEPVTVQSMRHLRKLENEHGVQSAAYNLDSSNFER